MWTMSLALHGTSACGERSPRKCAKPRKNNSAPANPHACSRSSSTRRARPGAGAAGSSPRPNKSPGKENPRYVVTSVPLAAWPTRELYEPLYCARGEMENRIKEQLSLFSDRMSTESLRSNQLRLYFSSLAYVLVEALRRVGLAGTEWAEYQVETIRLRLLKIAAQVRISG